MTDTEVFGYSSPYMDAAIAAQSVANAEIPAAPEPSPIHTDYTGSVTPDYTHTDQVIS